MRRLLLTMTIFLNLPLMAAEPSFVHCFDFGCKSQKEITYNAQQWQNVKDIFESTPLDVSGEKQAIRKAVALMEHFSGELVGTSLDKGGNYSGYDLEKQQDCIDESTNTYQYLKAIEELDLLKWHKVAPKKRRIVWFATHWTAVIEENQSNQLFAVDSWYRDNGEPPYIQKLEDWEDKDDFPVEYNPD
jgi:hypothetical protein